MNRRKGVALVCVLATALLPTQGVRFTIIPCGGCHAVTCRSPKQRQAAVRHTVPLNREKHTPSQPHPAQQPAQLPQSSSSRLQQAARGQDPSRNSSSSSQLPRALPARQPNRQRASRQQQRVRVYFALPLVCASWVPVSLSPGEAAGCLLSTSS